MPPKVRTAAERRRFEQSERAKRERVERGTRTPRIEAYDRNKRAASKVKVRNWQDWA